MDRPWSLTDEARASASLDRAAEQLASGRPDEARSLLATLARGTWARHAGIESVLRAVRMCGELGLVQEGLRLSEARLEHGPETPELRVVAGRLSVRRALDAPSERSERLRAAELHLRVALDQDPTDPRANALLGYILERQGRLQEAVEAWRSAHVLAPQDLEHRTGLAVALSSAGRFREAVSHFDAVARARPDQAEALVNLGLALRESGELERALSTFERVIALRPGVARTHVELGLTLRGMGRLDAALAAFDRAIELSPELVEAHHQKGRALVRAGRVEEAEGPLEVARRLAPHDRGIQRTLLEIARLPKSEDDETVAVATLLAPDLTAEVGRFAVAELVEFLGMGRRSGLLDVESPMGDAYVELLEGRLLSGRVEGQPSFLERLIALGVRLPPGVAEAEHARGAGALLEHLLDEGIGDRASLERAVFESSVEAILALLELREGRAEFRSRPAGSPGQDARLLDLCVDAQGVLLEAHRRLDEAVRDAR